MTAVTLEGDETRVELVELLTLLNADAKAISRRGYVGTMSERYELIHREYINDALDMLEALTMRETVAA